MNLGTLTSLVASMTGDGNQTRFAGKYTQAINLAQQQFAFDSRCLWKDAPTYTVVDGTASYDLPADFFLEKKVTHKGLRLVPISRETLERTYRSEDWTAIDGTPTHYLVDPEEGRKKLTVFPKPTGNDSGAYLVLTYYPVPTDLAAVGDTPFNSSALLVQFHIAIAAWASWLLLGYDKPDAAIEEKRKNYLQIYNDKVSEAVDTFKNTASEPLRQSGSRCYT